MLNNFFIKNVKMHKVFCGGLGNGNFRGIGCTVQYNNCPHNDVCVCVCVCVCARVRTRVRREIAK